MCTEIHSATSYGSIQLPYLFGCVKYLCLPADTSTRQQGQLNAVQLATVEPHYNGHHWDPTFCPL